MRPNTLVAACLLMALPAAPGGAQITQTETIVLDPGAPTRPFPHFWEQMFGSGRAILSLRESWRSDLKAVKAVTGVQYIRFHAIFHDEVGIYSQDPSGKPVFNFSYADQIY